MSNVSNNTAKLVEYLDLQAQKLRIDLQAARLYLGTTDIGDVAENSVRKFLQAILPERYSLGIGEVIASSGQKPHRVDQTQQKDVLIYDPYGSAVFGWDDSPKKIFPVESIYGVLEVKTCIYNKDDLLNAVEQTLEVKRLCIDNRTPNQKSPFTAVFAFETKVAGRTLFDVLQSRQPNERPDFVLILDQNFYFTHWHYYSRGSGSIDFVTADETAKERADSSSENDKFLTFGETERALLWFYLFLIEQLDSMHLTKPNFWQYARANQERLGWKHDES